MSRLVNRIDRNVSIVLRCWTTCSVETTSWAPSWISKDCRSWRTSSENSDCKKPIFYYMRYWIWDWLKLLVQTVSMATAYRRIRSFGLPSFRPFLCLPFINIHHTRRLQWCHEREHWLYERHYVVFSGESPTNKGQTLHTVLTLGVMQ